VTVVGKPGGEGRAIIECEQGFPLGELKLLLESVDILPIFQYFLFLFGEVGSLRD
jgi:hypothetical protein